MTTSRAMAGATLSTSDLLVRFGAVVAVDHVSIECRTGELCGLIGPNGAGKTTLVDAITGFVPSSGAVEFDGQDVSNWAPHRLAQAGLRRTWQSLELFDDISVRANLDVACDSLSARGVIRDLIVRGGTDAGVDWVLELLGLTSYADRLPRELPQGRRKLLGIARALVAKPKLLLLDEPAAGLDRSETIWLGQQLRRLVDLGYAMLLIDHDMSLVLSVCDRVHVLHAGELIASGTPAAIRTDARVLTAYLGPRTQKT